MKFYVVVAAFVIGIMLTTAAGATSVSLTAIDWDSIAANNTNYNNSSYMFIGGGGAGLYDGFMKFDLSSLPSEAVINSMSLSAVSTFYRYQDVTLEVQRVATNNWSRTTNDLLPGLIGSVSDPVTITAFGSYTWDIDPNEGAAQWWKDDVDNDFLSLSLHSPEGGWPSSYFYRTANLTIEYEEGSSSVPEPAAFSFFGMGLLGLIFRRRKV